MRFSFPFGRECSKRYGGNCRNEPWLLAGNNEAAVETETARRYGRARSLPRRNEITPRGNRLERSGRKAKRSILGGSRGRSLRQSNWPKESSLSLCPLAGFDNRRRLKGSYSSRREPGESLTSNCCLRFHARELHLEFHFLPDSSFLAVRFTIPRSEIVRQRGEALSFLHVLPNDTLCNRQKDTASDILIV